MALKQIGVIEIPHSRGSSFDHGAFDAKTRRVFVAHTGRDCIEVIDHDAGKHIATLQGFTEAAGVVAEDGQVLVTNRGAASLAWVDARTLKTHAVFATGPTPNGVAIAPRRRLAIAACIGNEAQGPTLQVIGLDGGPQHTINLPGRPRWCVTDAAAERVFLAIREPSMVLVADLPALNKVEHWKIPAAGAHGLEIDREADRLFVACDDRALVQVNIASGKATHQPHDGPRPCCDRRPGSRALDRPAQWRQYPAFDRYRSPHDGIHHAGPAVRVLSPRWRSTRTFGYLKHSARFL
jgi:DNA-binding beta-propeller fold protein YncE